MDSTNKLNAVSSQRPIQTLRRKAILRKSFRFKVALRLVAICLLGILTIFLIFSSPYWLAGIWTALATVALFYETVKYVDQSERKLTSFLQSLKQNDFSVTFAENYNSDEYDLHHAFNALNDTFKHLRSEKESQHQLLQVIVDYAAVPLICFDEENDKVFLINNAAKNLFDIQFLQKMQSLWRVDRTLPDFLKKISDGEKSSYRIVMKGKPVFLSVISRHFVFRGEKLKLIALTDVSSELTAREAEAWQKLLRVLTHEISNSAIPLSTLSSYIYEMFNKSEAENRNLEADERSDILESLRTIDQRSKSLKEFVHNFRSVNQVPDPTLMHIGVTELINEIGNLFAQHFIKENIDFIRPTGYIDQTIFADRNLTMQVLINLIKNAMESMSNFKDRKQIVISVEREGPKYVNISISDTGCGIEGDELDQIFVPFYSTKKSGSGIGLSISQQIMQKQKGNIIVSSTPGRGSVFTLNFMA
ncbi:MAG: ATP-binding protein [Chryseolinea sp.]